MAPPDKTDGAPAVVAVVVSYHPDRERLAEMLRTTAAQVDRIVLVDNGSGSPLRELAAAFPSVMLVQLHANVGVGQAQNEGIERARALGAAYVLLMDQDSVPAPDMVLQLRRALERSSAEGRPVGAVGPLRVDANGRAAVPGFTRFEGLVSRPVMPAGDAPTVPCDMIIASGTFAPVEVFSQCGAMNAGLFVDKVDTEWCLRVRARGYEIHGVPAAHLMHRLGERTMRMRMGRTGHVSVHQPFRYYYMVRNSLLVRRMPHATRAWRRADAWELAKMVVLFGVLVEGRRANARMMWRGFVDGRRGVTGAQPATASSRSKAA